MPLFEVYFLPEVSGNEPLYLDLGLTADAISVVTGPVADKRRRDLGDPHGFCVFEIVAAETLPIGPFFAGVIREGDVVWRDWSVFRNQPYLHPTELERQMRAYKPIWEPGPGWLELRQERWGDVEVR